MAAIDQMIGRYRLLQRLGQGGMGEVWKALDTGVTQREVALKLVLSEEDPAMLHVLSSEARAMAQLPMHPNLVALLDVVEAEQSLVLVMEYVPGPTLRGVIKNYPGGLPWGLIAPLAEGLLHGLEHAHAHHVIHRDLKPENVKLLGFDGTKAAKPASVKILDFGLARAQKEQSTRFTRGASGTFAYMAPEQLTGQPQSEATDLYALGILLFEMACGQPPFGGAGRDSFGAIYQGHTSEPPPLPSLSRHDAPTEFDLAVLAALSKQPGTRPQSAEALAELLLPTLRALAANRSLVAPVAVAALPPVDSTSKTSTPHHVSPLAPPMPGPPSAGGNRTVLDARQLPAAPLVATAPARVPATAPEFPATKPRRKTMLWIGGALATAVVIISLMAFSSRGSQSGSSVSSSPQAAQVAVKSNFVNSIGMTLVAVPAGSFTMGSTEGNDEQPMHTVTIARPFHMAQTETTQGQWEAIMGTRPWAGESYVKNGPDYPAVYVSWDDAQEFCRRLSTKEGKPYRLPSEAEWEYAARAGSSGKWCFGNDGAGLGEYAWFGKNASDIGEKFAHRVGTKRANAFGLYDMHGNVWEWCEDTWHANYNGAPADGSAWIGTDIANRVSRGGGFDNGATGTRSAFRSGVAPAYRADSLGFRVVCAVRT